LRLERKLIDLGYLEGDPEAHLSGKAIAAFNQWRHETGKSPVASIGPDEFNAFMRAVNR